MIITQPRLVIVINHQWDKHTKGIRFLRIPKDENDYIGRRFENGSYRVVEDIRESTDLATWSEEKSLRLFYNIKDTKGLEAATVSLFEATVTLDLKEKVIDSQMVKDFLIHRALAKLSADEIQALNLGSLATYDKLKN